MRKFHLCLGTQRSHRPVRPHVGSCRPCDSPNGAAAMPRAAHRDRRHQRQGPHQDAAPLACQRPGQPPGLRRGPTSSPRQPRHRTPSGTGHAAVFRHPPAPNHATGLPAAISPELWRSMMCFAALPPLTSGPGSTRRVRQFPGPPRPATSGAVGRVLPGRRASSPTGPVARSMPVSTGSARPRTGTRSQRRAASGTWIKPIRGH
jgi:hypothetical protein